MYPDVCLIRPVTLAIMFLPPIILGLTILLPIGLLLPKEVAPCQWSCLNGTEPCLPQSRCPFTTFDECQSYFHNTSSSSSESYDRESYAKESYSGESYAKESYSGESYAKESYSGESYSEESLKKELCTLYLESNQTVELTLPFFSFFSYGFDFDIVFDGFQTVTYSYSNQGWTVRLDWHIDEISVSNYDVAFIATLYVNFTNYPYDHDYSDDHWGDRSGLFISQVTPSTNVIAFLISTIVLTIAWLLICFIAFIVISSIRRRLSRGTEMKSLNTVSTWYEALNED